MVKLNREKSMPLEDAASKVTSSDVDLKAILGNELHNDDTVTNNNVRTVTTLQDNAWIEFYNGFITELKGLKEENHALQPIAELHKRLDELPAKSRLYGRDYLVNKTVRVIVLER